MTEKSSYDHCREKAAADGSDFYYAVLYYPETTQKKLIALQAFALEVDEIIHECSDPGVARIKFQWWREECDRIMEDEARHPIGRELSRLFIATQSTELTGDFFFRYIDSVETRLNQTAYTDEHTLNQHLIESNGLLWSMFARVCEIKNETSLEKIKEIAVTLAKAEQLICLLPQGQKRHYFIEQTALTKHQLTLDDFLTEKNENLLNEFLRETYNKLIQNLDNGFQNLPEEDKKPFLFGLTLNRLIKTHCQKQLKQTHLVQPTILLPIHKLWTAWRLKRRYF